MTTTIEHNVGIDHAQSLYVIKHGDGYTCLGFDVCLERIERYALSLGICDIPKASRGTREAYDILMTLQDAIREHYERTGERSTADLSPQLTGLEGWRVEVEDEPGDKPRRFIVGKSTGWLPIHLEISRRTAHGGGAARLEYHSVRQIEKVR